MNLEIFRSNLYAWHGRLFEAQTYADVAAALGLTNLPINRKEKKPCGVIFGHDPCPVQVAGSDALCPGHKMLIMNADVNLQTTLEANPSSLKTPSKEDDPKNENRKQNDDITFTDLTEIP